MKRLSTVLLAIILMYFAVMGAHAETSASGGLWTPETVYPPIYPDSPEDIFLKGYHADGEGIWVKIDPPMMQEQPSRPVRDLMDLLKDMIQGIYTRFDGDGNPKDLIICELKPEKKNGERGWTKREINTSALSSQLSMTAQFYDEAAKSFRRGEFKRSKSLPPDKKILINIPVKKGIIATIWFDIKKRQWILYGSDRPSGTDTSRQLNKLAAFLRNASTRSTVYINEIYYLDFSQGTPKVMEVETHSILPPGHSGRVSAKDISSREHAEERGIRLGGYLMKAFGRTAVTKDHTRLSSADLTVSENKQDQSGSVKKVPSKVIGRPTEILPLPKQYGNNGMVFSRALWDMYSGEAHKPTWIPDPHVICHISDPVISDVPWKSQSPYVPMELPRRQALDTIASRHFAGSLYPPDHIFGHKAGSFNLINGQRDIYVLSGLDDIPGPRGPELDLSTGVLVGMGLGMEAAALGTSLLPAGTVTTLSNISALVGGATFLTGGVVIAAVVAGASIQYLFHLHDSMIDRKRIEHLLDSVDSKMADEGGD